MKSFKIPNWESSKTGDIASKELIKVSSKII